MSILLGLDEKSPYKSTKKRNQKNSKANGGGKHEDLLVFGYHCKLFRDNTAAEDVNKRSHLIPWMGNSDLMIDRYDCRGHLYRLDDFDLSSSSSTAKKILTPEEIDIESILDEERYLDLNKDMDEENILHEEEEKRCKNLYDPHTAYQTIGYSYEENNKEEKTLSELSTDDVYKQYCLYYGYDSKDLAVKAYYQGYQKQQYDYERPPPPPDPPQVSPGQPGSPPTVPTTQVKPAENVEPEKFEPPEGIEIPKNLEVPETRKMQSIIEKTAMFLSKQSGQMEIVLKTKQSGNPQFAFLDFQNYLNPYYKFILGKIREGKYMPETDAPKEAAEKESEKRADRKPEEKSEEDDDDNDSDDDCSGDLHPLLQAHRRPIPKVETKKPTEVKKPESATKPTLSPIEKKPGRVEDLARIYMSMKYKSNPEPEAIVEIPPQQPHYYPPQFQQNPAGLPQPPYHMQVIQPSLQMDHNQFTNEISQPFRSPHSQPPPGLFPPSQFGGGIQPVGNNFRPQPQAQLPPPDMSRFYNHQSPRIVHPPPSIGNQQQMVNHPQQGVNHPQPAVNHQQQMFPQHHMLQEGNGEFYRSAHHHGHPVSYQRQPQPERQPQLRHQHPPPSQATSDFVGVQDYGEGHDLKPPGVDDESDKPTLPPPPPPPSAPNLNEIAVTNKTSNIATNQIQKQGPVDTEITCIKQSDLQSSSFSHLSNTSERPENFNESDQRYRPSQMLSEILKSRDLVSIERSPEIYDSPNHGNYSSTKQIGYNSTNNDNYCSPYISGDHDSPRSQTEYYDSTLRKEYFSDSPGRRDFVDSSNSDYHIDGYYHEIGSSGCDTLKTHETESPFLKLSESLKMLQRQEIKSKPEFETQKKGLEDFAKKEVLVDPSPDLKSVIDRLATYVAKNGEEFEAGINEKNDPRFDFLNPWNIYHVYYKQSKQRFIIRFEKEKKKEQEKEQERKKNLKVSFGLKPIVKPNTVSVKRKPAPRTAAAAIFNQEDEYDEDVSEGTTEQNNVSLTPQKELNKEARKEALSYQIVEKERLLKQLHDQTVIDGKALGSCARKINGTPQQQAALKRKAQTDRLKKENSSSENREERRRKAVSFVERLKSNQDHESNEDSDNNVQIKRRKDNGTLSDDSNNENEEKQGAFFAAINQAFKRQ